MENQVNESKELNVKGIILLVGAIFSGLIGAVACATFTGVITGAIIGLLFAAFFNAVLLPEKASDR